jgi:hypothetical protein
MPLHEDVGTPGVGVRAETLGMGLFNRTTLYVDTTMPAIAGGAALAVGALVYTLPAGADIISGSQLNIALQQVDGNVDADTPDIGLGTTIASGVVSVLGGTAAFENIMTGQTAADCDGAATLKTIGTQLVIEAAGGHGVYLNIADTWAASGDATLGASGEIVLFWTPVS